jgi:ATP-GRASP peptide maturase of grasp-with-spasm system
MILLLSCDGDLSCDLVIDWLNYYKADYIRINSFDFFRERIKIIQGKDGLQSFEINEIELNTNKTNIVWFRKFGFFEESNFYKKISENFNFDITQHISREFNKLLNFFLLNLKDKRWLTNPFKININKPYVLQIASKIGFNIPNTFIINNITVLNQINQNLELISKSILDPIIAEFDNNRCMMYTSQISDVDKNNLPDSFFPSYVQEKIEKEYELRIFFLNGICYSMAIFSQKDTKTKLDFRIYNWEKPNRFLPYKMPKEETIKIKRLMRSLELNCASIDMIKATDGKYYFLEVNPTGQFGMLDFPCNYGLHKRIAETLIKFDI